MKNLFQSAVLALAALSIASCNKDALTKLANITFTQPYSFEVDLPSASTVDSLGPVPVPGGSAALPAFSFTFPTEINKIAEDNNTSLDKLVAVKLSEFTLVPLLPAGQNLNFINSIELRMSAPGLPETIVAQKAVFPKDVSSVTLDVSGDNLKDYFVKDNITIQVAANVNAIPPTGTKIRFDTKYKITANPLK